MKIASNKCVCYLVMRASSCLGVPCTRGGRVPLCTAHIILNAGPPVNGYQSVVYIQHDTGQKLDGSVMINCFQFTTSKRFQPESTTRKKR